MKSDLKRQDYPGIGNNSFSRSITLNDGVTNIGSKTYYFKDLSDNNDPWAHYVNANYICFVDIEVKNGEEINISNYDLKYNGSTFGIIQNWNDFDEDTGDPVRVYSVAVPFNLYTLEEAGLESAKSHLVVDTPKKNTVVRPVGGEAVLKVDARIDDDTDEEPVYRWYKASYDQYYPYGTDSFKALTADEDIPNQLTLKDLSYKTENKESDFARYRCVVSFGRKYDEEIQIVDFTVVDSAVAGVFKLVPISDVYMAKDPGTKAVMQVYPEFSSSVNQDDYEITYRWLKYIPVDGEFNDSAKADDSYLYPHEEHYYAEILEAEDDDTLTIDALKETDFAEYTCYATLWKKNADGTKEAVVDDPITGIPPVNDRYDTSFTVAKAKYAKDVFERVQKFGDSYDEDYGLDNTQIPAYNVVKDEENEVEGDKDLSLGVNLVKGDHEYTYKWRFAKEYITADGRRYYLQDYTETLETTDPVIHIDELEEKDCGRYELIIYDEEGAVYTPLDEDGDVVSRIFYVRKYLPEEEDEETLYVAYDMNGFGSGYNPLTLVRDIGKKATLKVKAVSTLGNDKIKYQWYYNNDYEETNMDTRFMGDDYLDAIYGETTDTLAFAKLTENDRGVYTCVITDGKDKKALSFEITDKIRELDVTNDDLDTEHKTSYPSRNYKVIKKIGDNVTFAPILSNTTDYNNGTESYMWFRGYVDDAATADSRILTDKKVTYTEKSYTINKITLDDFGWYTCAITNGNNGDEIYMHYKLVQADFYNLRFAEYSEDLAKGEAEHQDGMWYDSYRKLKNPNAVEEEDKDKDKEETEELNLVISELNDPYAQYVDSPADPLYSQEYEYSYTKKLSYVITNKAGEYTFSSAAVSLAGDTPSYQWEVWSDIQQRWIAMSGETSKEIKVTVTEAELNLLPAYKSGKTADYRLGGVENEYRCAVTAESYDGTLYHYVYLTKPSTGATALLEETDFDVEVTAENNYAIPGQTVTYKATVYNPNNYALSYMWCGYDEYGNTVDLSQFPELPVTISADGTTLTETVPADAEEYDDVKFTCIVTATNSEGDTKSAKDWDYRPELLTVPATYLSGADLPNASIFGTYKNIVGYRNAGAASLEFYFDPVWTLEDLGFLQILDKNGNVVAEYPDWDYNGLPTAKVTVTGDTAYFYLRTYNSCSSKEVGINAYTFYTQTAKDNNKKLGYKCYVPEQGGGTVDPGEQPIVTTTYVVSFNSNGGTLVPEQRVNKGDKATEPKNPVKEGYAFEGWYVDDTLAVPYDFNTPVNSSFTLFGKWVVGSSSAAQAVTGDTVKTTGNVEVKITSTADGNKTAEYVPQTSDAGKSTITIPSTVVVGSETYTVTSIAPKAFAYEAKLTKVVIPATIETIGKAAFAADKKLTTVSFAANSNLKTMEDNVFENCEKLKSVDLSMTKITTLPVARSLRSSPLTEII